MLRKIIGDWGSYEKKAQGGNIIRPAPWLSVISY